MSKFLPTIGFKCTNPKNFDLNKYVSNSSKGRVAVVDILISYENYTIIIHSVYGKTMENLRNRIDVRLVSNKKDYLKWTSKPNYMSHKLLDNDLDAIRKNKVTFRLSKPAYNGMCTLELSKVLIYELYFGYIKNKHGNNWRLLFTNNDSLMYEIKTEDVYEDFSNNKEMFDFSNYSTKSKYYDNSNNLVIGKIKQETAGVAVEEFVRLKRRMY